jgi:hypothetical protein
MNTAGEKPHQSPTNGTPNVTCGQLELMQGE